MLDWQKQLGEDALNNLSSSKLLKEPNAWKDKLDNTCQTWLLFEMLNRVVNIKNNSTKNLNETFLGTFTVSAYDLSVASCGKKLDDPAYGITASGFNLKGKSRISAMCIAADKQYPFGTKFRIECDQPYDYINGTYTVLDRGGSIVGNKLDIFFGDYGSETPSNDAMKFGIKSCRIFKLN